ncbi:MAG TPA: twin-arginine translocation pathway signal protein [Candidatus Limnocylindria bacterium]|jgi:protocatechuate 3,4-dioxygenase beta subunit
MRRQQQHDDDAPVGRILSRREVLALLGESGAVLLAACAPGVLATPSPTTAAQPTNAAATAAASSAATLPSCIVRPAVTQGPYFVDEKLNRSDIRSDPTTGAVKDGAPFALTFLVSRVTGSACAALSGATVDIWHCDALGVYSDATDPSFNTKGQKFLRGYQTTDATGKALFTTIYPGWYQGRAVHIHFKIRTATSEFTSQLFFEDALNTLVFAQLPYSQKGTQAVMKNAADGIYKSQLLLAVTKNGNAYAATFDIGLAS